MKSSLFLALVLSVASARAQDTAVQRQADATPSTVDVARQVQVVRDYVSQRSDAAVLFVRLNPMSPQAAITNTVPLLAGAYLDVKATDAWKVAYLRRLRAEKTDESYIKAYLKAWNLDPKDVFGGQ